MTSNTDITGVFPLEFMSSFYPLMQAFDSIELKADIELRTDQTFNILMGRTLQKHMGQEQQIALFMPILEGVDGKENEQKPWKLYWDKRTC